MQELLLSVVYSPFLRQLTCRLTAIIGVGCRQPDTDSALVDFEAQTALAIIVGLLAQFRVLGCILPQALL